MDRQENVEKVLSLHQQTLNQLEFSPKIDLSNAIEAIVKKNDILDEKQLLPPLEFTEEPMMFQETIQTKNSLKEIQKEREVNKKNTQLIEKIQHNTAEKKEQEIILNLNENPLRPKEEATYESDEEIPEKRVNQIDPEIGLVGNDFRGLSRFPSFNVERNTQQYPFLNINSYNEQQMLALYGKRTIVPQETLIKHSFPGISSQSVSFPRPFIQYIPNNGFQLNNRYQRPPHFLIEHKPEVFAQSNNDTKKLELIGMKRNRDEKVLNTPNKKQKTENSKSRKPRIKRINLGSKNKPITIKSRKGKRKMCEKWTEEEKKRLLFAVTQFKAKNWKAIAELVRTKDANQCNQHWHRVLHPTINKEKFTKEEDNLLIQRVKLYGIHSWKRISEEINGRTDIQCRHRFVALKKKLGLKEIQEYGTLGREMGKIRKKRSK